MEKQIFANFKALKSSKIRFVHLKTVKNFWKFNGEILETVCSYLCMKFYIQIACLVSIARDQHL